MMMKKSFLRFTNTFFSVTFCNTNPAVSKKGKLLQLPVNFFKNSCNEMKNVVINKICDFCPPYPLLI